MGKHVLRSTVRVCVLGQTLKIAIGQDYWKIGRGGQEFVQHTFKRTTTGQTDTVERQKRRVRAEVSENAAI